MLTPAQMTRIISTSWQYLGRRVARGKKVTMLFWHNKTIDRTRERRQRTPAILLIISAVVATLGFSAVCGSVMWEMRRSAVDLAQQAAGNLASTIESDISRNIELYDLSLRAVVDNLGMPALAAASKPIMHMILFDHAATAKHFGAIQVFDANGNLTHDSTTLDPSPVNRADEAYFTVQRDNPDAGLFISRPMLYGGAYAVVLSRRISGPDGRFRGVVTGSIRFSYFHELFARLSLGSQDTITVFRKDGLVIMRTPFDLDVVGRNLNYTPGVGRVLKEPAGSLSSSRSPDGVDRLYVWRGGASPLVVLVGKPWTDILGLWHKEAMQIGIIMLGLIVLLAAGTLFVVREMRQRSLAEEKLEELATTDALTGLRNRRKFDSVIDAEWRRAMRQHTPLALLMIDADHFKTYNDQFGHQAGDQVLVGISICISDSARRVEDCAARYGGEEFALLLPGLSAAEATKVAESIRLKVEQWSGDPAVTTVSIGVASMIPVTTMETSSLIEAADKALYTAKRNGRNQSVAATPASLSLVA
jgi:diguanylate cyclase (GGDEF)-like protein